MYPRPLAVLAEETGLNDSCLPPPLTRLMFYTEIDILHKDTFVRTSMHRQYNRHWDLVSSLLLLYDMTEALSMTQLSHGSCIHMSLANVDYL